MTANTAPEPAQPLDGVVHWFTLRRFALVLGALILLAYPDALLLGRTFFFRDFALFGYPLAAYHRECFWQGELPFWTAYHNLGQPFLAQWNTLTLYPGSLIYLLLPMPWSLNLFCLLHLFLGGLGMFLLVRQLLNHPLAAAFAGLAYTFNGFALTSLMWPNNIAAWGWLPWVLWALRRAWLMGGKALPVAALICGLQILTGGPEIILQTWLLCGGFFLLEIWQSGWCWKRLGRSAAIFGLALALAAIQLLPFADLLAHSQRDSGFGTGNWAMPAWGWLNLFVPIFNSERGLHGIYTQLGHLWVDTYYPGVLITLLALFTLFRKPSKLVLGGWLVIFFSLAIAQGANGFLYEPLRAYLPFLGYIRFPVKFIILAISVLPILAAIGLTHVWDLAKPEKTLRWQFLTLTAVMVGLVVLASWLDSYLLLPSVAWYATLESGAYKVLLFIGAGILLLCSCDAAWARHRVSIIGGFLFLVWFDAIILTQRPNPTAEAWIYQPDHIRQELYLAGDISAAGPRFLPSTESLYRMRAFSPKTGEEQVSFGRMTMFDNLNLLDHVPTLRGFYSLELRPYSEMLRYYRMEPAEKMRPLHEFAGFAYTQPEGKVTEWVKQWNPAPLVTAGQKPVLVTDQEVFARLKEGNFHPALEAYFYAGDAGDLDDVVPGQAQVKSIIWTHQKIQFYVIAQAPSIVVLAQTYYHPWVAKIKGQSVPLRPVNHAFTALKVPAGIHAVELTYEDHAFRRGAWISGVALLIISALWFLAHRRKEVTA